MAAAQDLTGVTLDARYRLTRLMGAGGMGQVYEGQHDTLDRKVAVKVLLPRFAYDERFRERFLREARAASKVRHPNVVQILDFGTTPNDSVYFAMEFLEGRDLRTVLYQDGALPWARARHLLLQMTAALSAAHERNIIHRDIKPANFFVLHGHGVEDFVKVLDFGIAKVAADSNSEDTSAAQSLTGTGEIFGTAKYMAPEQAFGASDDPRVDVYSLGVVAYEMLTQRVPFKGVSAFEIITRHVNEPPKPLRELVPDIPPQVEAVVLRAMGKKPDDRFSSMEEFRAAWAAISANATGYGTPGRRRSLAEVDPTLRGAEGSASMGGHARSSTGGFGVGPPPPDDASTSIAPMPAGLGGSHTQVAVLDDSGPGAATTQVPQMHSHSGSTGSLGFSTPMMARPDANPTDLTATGFGPRPRVWLAVLAGMAVVLLAALVTAHLLSSEPTTEPAAAAAPILIQASAPPVAQPEIGPTPVIPMPAAESPGPDPAMALPPAADPPQPDPVVTEPAAPPVERKVQPTSRRSSGSGKSKVETDARAQSRLVKLLKRKCRGVAGGATVSVRLLVRPTGDMNRPVPKSGSPELKACMIDASKGFTFPPGKTRSPTITVAF